MNQKRTQHIISVLLFVTFIILEVMSVHVLFHDHAKDKDHCPVCEVSFVFNHLPYIGSDNQIKINNVICYEEHINLFNYYSLIIDEKQDAATIVNRPPPSQVSLS